MKFKFDIECTPEEARAFLGLPDIVPLQEKMMKEVEDRMQENIRNLTPEEMMKTWMPATMQGLGDIQKAFWGQMGVNTPKPDTSAKSDNDKSTDKS